jgi:hypothetical protein
MKKTTTEVAALIHSKDSVNSLKSKILGAFYAGQWVQAKTLNSMFFFNDARKIISILRRNGYHIIDRRRTDRCKEYKLIPDSQLSLNLEGEI